jgi:hypothetical protein
VNGFQGLFELRTTNHLFKKLEYDLGRLGQDRTNQYAAFDFFVTAHHMEDWVYPDEGGKQNKGKRKQLEARSPLLQICSHIANGSKHFKATAKHHRAVKDTSLRKGAFDSIAFASDAFDTSRLVISLDENVAKQLSLHTDEIECLVLAEKVLKFWKEHLASLTL